jgi:hypothetical protein
VRCTAFNRIVLDGLELPEEVTPGEIRRDRVGVARYPGPLPEDCAFLLARLCDWLNGPELLPPEPARMTLYGMVRAILAHLYLAWIHPFGDGNGRTARLVEFLALVSSGVPSAAAHLLSNHYNETRSDYYRQLDQASRSGGDVLPFLQYALQGFVDGLQGQLIVIRKQQWDMTWRDHVHEVIKGRRSPVNDRRRDLILDLSQRDVPVPIEEIRHITPRIMPGGGGVARACCALPVVLTCRSGNGQPPDGMAGRRQGNWPASGCEEGACGE